jgi:two-component sensor histidine kinase
MEPRDGRADRYVSDRTAGELKQLRGDLAVADSQSEAGSLASRLIAAYAGAIDTESNRRAWVDTAATMVAARYQGTYPGIPKQAGRARHVVTAMLGGCPVADDCILIVSELCSNAILHSASRDGMFVVRVDVRPGDQVRIEVEDSGGRWIAGTPNGVRGRGLDIVAALTGPGNWGVNGDAGGRTVWARISMAEHGLEASA